MEVEFIKDWPCASAPGGVWEKGKVTKLTLANAQSAIKGKFAKVFKAPTKKEAEKATK